MTQYAKVNFDTYIKVADLKKAALIKNPVPENINAVKTLDDFVKDIFKDKKKLKDLDFDNVLAKIQSQNRSIMGSLSNIWTAAGSARLSQEYSVNVDLKKNCAAAGTSIKFHILLRRFYMLSPLKNLSQQSKQMLKEEK